MKFAAIAAIAATSVVAAADDQTPEEKRQAVVDKTNYVVDAFKGFHEGFYKALYKETEAAAGADECLNAETIDNMVTYVSALSDPKHMFSSIANAQEGFNVFAEGAEIFENIAKCRMEGPLFDIIHLCATEKDACLPSTIGENVTKNMFVLVGKCTSMTETFKGFPAKDKEAFKDQMSQVGDDFGTLLRVLFNYHKN